MRAFASSITLAYFLVPYVSAIDLDITDPNSIKDAAKTIAGDIMNIYNTTDKESIGIFESPYLWWEAGLVWDTFVDYWFLTGDAEFNDQVTNSLTFQTGSNHDYMPPNQTKTEGNDDQAFWALAAMTAAERSFPVPSGQPSWLTLAENVFNDQAARWDNKTCDGGLRWQILTFNDGYDYKNALSNGLFLELAARLALFTGNRTYATWANESFTWMQSTGLISHDLTTVYDGADVANDCKKINHIQWTANLAPILAGSAIMANLTSGGSAQQSAWQTRTTALLNATTLFWTATGATATDNGTLFEPACEPEHTCDTDQFAYKGILATALARTAYFAPSTAAFVTPVLNASAKGAAAACAGPSVNTSTTTAKLDRDDATSSAAGNGTACGTSWRAGDYDGTSGLSQEIAALSAVLALLEPGMGTLASVSRPDATGAGGNGSTTTGGASSTASSGAQGTNSAKPSGGAVVVVGRSVWLLALGMGAVFWLLV
ncbi:MAG: hydrolase 76 protein [Bathelium mastoideum]|nr:MAG: hydrolase 76 protein [Bathelium mastoideum]